MGDERDGQGLPEVREEDQGAAVPGGRGCEEPGEDGGAGNKAAGEDQNLQEADGGGRGEEQNGGGPDRRDEEGERKLRSRNLKLDRSPHWKATQNIFIVKKN